MADSLSIFQMVEEINKYLTPIIGEKNLYAWWDSPNKALNGRTPLEELPAQYEVMLLSIKKALKSEMNGDFS